MPSNFCSKLIPCLFSIGLLAVVLILCSNLIEAKSGGIIVDLIHRDSPMSPLYNPRLTHFQRQNNAFQRSLSRVSQFASIGVFPNGGEYLMKISYGTPPFETVAIIDTASDLFWTQCQKCTNCFKGKNPPFDPKKSSTFKLVGCNTQTCKEVTGANNCSSSSNSCEYRSDYDDRSYSRGEIATDTITLGGNAFPSFPFGCGHDNGGLWSHEASGLVGLGYSNASLVTHISYSTGWRFSYCLGPSTELSKPGKLNLGDVISGDGVVSTPIILSKYYQVTLEAVSVDEKRFEFPKNSPSNNIVTDSGTSFTGLPKDLYQGIASTVKERINSTKTVPRPNKFLNLCYSSLDGLKIPSITFHFKGADLKLVNPINTFVATSDSAFCLAFAPSVGMNLFGNVQQSNFWVGYDLQNKVFRLSLQIARQHDLLNIEINEIISLII